MAFLAPLLGFAGGLISSNAANHNSQQMQQMLNGIMQNYQGVENQGLAGISGMQGDASQYLSGLPQLTSLMGQEGTGVGAQAPGAASSYLGNAMDPNALAQQTGINAGGLTQNATNYLSNPNATNLAGVNPSLQSFYGNEMQNGLNPQVAENAQNQLQQNFAQSQSNINAQAGPGQNVNAERQAAQNSLLSNSTNLAGNLAGQSQQIMGQGAAGLGTTAANLDQQKQQMLTNAATMGTNYNQTVLGNQQAGADFGQNILGMLQNFASQGNTLNQNAIGDYGSIGQTLNQQGEYFGGLASNAAGQAAQTNPFSMAGNVASMFGGGGLGSIFGGGGGGFSGFTGANTGATTL